MVDITTHASGRYGAQVITWRSGVVMSVDRAWRGAQELTVQFDGEGDSVRALAYPELVGKPVVGDRVLVNTSALDRELGTGGYALVIALPERLPADPLPTPGHLVKARYTPMQTLVLGVDEQDSEHHRVLAEADDLLDMPVVVADLHSALPAIIAGARHAAQRAGIAPPRVAYVMTDGGALPAWFSRNVSGLRAAGWLETCVTVGQAFGGDLEAATVHTGLLAARHVSAADIAVVAQGPGNLGTGTRWGFSGVAAGEAINAVAALRGRPVAALRISGADKRSRHHGVSHHSLTAYGRVALARADVVVPDLAGSTDPDLVALGVKVDLQVTGLGGRSCGHRLVRIPVTDLYDALEASPVALSTMGRGLPDDPAAFLASAAAGAHAAALYREARGPARLPSRARDDH